jgi:tRNA-binding EMAP/Myf-like protein
MKGIYNSEGMLLAVTSPSYEIMQHQDLYDVFTNYLSENQIKVYDYELWKSASDSRVQLFCTFSNPEYKVEIKEGDTIAFGMKVAHALDGSQAINITPWARRLVCSNGMIATVNGRGYSQKHYYEKNWNIETIENWFENHQDEQNVMADLWRTLEQTELNVAGERYVRTMLVGDETGDILNAEIITQKELGQVQNLISLRNRKKILEAWSRSEDKTAWDVYNRITYQGTHGTSSPMVRERILKAANLYAGLVTR